MRAVRQCVAAVLAVAGAAGCASAGNATTVAARGSGANLARNGDFEAAPAPARDCPSSWWCSMHSDTGSFRFSLDADAGSNGRFLRVTRVKDEPWALATQIVSANVPVGARVKMTVAVGGEGLEGAAGPAIMLHGVGGRVIDHRQTLLARGPGWRRASAEIEMIPGVLQVEIGLLLEGGGTVGFDDVEVTVLPPTRP